MPRLAPGSTQEGNPIGHIGQITQGAIHAVLSFSLPHAPVSPEHTRISGPHGPGPARADSASYGRNSLLLMTKPVGQVS